jgi:hypothetical protein
MGELSKLSQSLVLGYQWNNQAEYNGTATTGHGGNFS